MNFYYEAKADLNKNQLDLIELVKSNTFPWYYQESTSPKFMFYGHTLMTRNELNLGGHGAINSDYYGYFYEIFVDFCKKHDIEYSHVLRAALNSTGYFPDVMGDIHTDHNFEHKNFLMYLNVFTNGKTYIFNESKEIIKTIDPEEHKVSIFSGELHAQGFCNPYERRIALIMTFV